LCILSEMESFVFWGCMIFSVYEHVCYVCGVQGIMTSSLPERAFKGVFPSNIDALQSGPTGADFTVLGQSRAKRSDPCVRVGAGGDETTHAYTHTHKHTHAGLSGEL